MAGHSEARRRPEVTATVPAGAWASCFVALQRERDEAVIRGAVAGVTSPSPAPAPAGASLATRVRPLVAQGLGRIAIAKQLAITQHQARQALAEIKGLPDAVGGTS